MVNPIQISNFKYHYNIESGFADNLGDYARFPSVTSATQLHDEMDKVNSVTGRLKQDTRTTFKVIPLCVPVLNFTLGYKDGKLLANILGIDVKRWLQILDCEIAWSKKDNCEVSNPSTGTIHDYYLGTNYIYKLIDEFNVEEAILSTLTEEFLGCVPKAVRDNVTINKQEAADALNIVGKYYAHFGTPCNISEVEASWLKKYQTLCKSTASRLPLLLALPTDKSSLYGMVAPFVMVLPYAMRQTSGFNGKHEHPLTEMYQRIIEQNAAFISFYRSAYATIRQYAVHYHRLQDAVNILYYGKDLLHNKMHPNDDKKSITEILSTKHGQIRKYNLGKRQDYSGRSVVTISPYLPLDRINLPKAMIIGLYEKHALPYLLERLDHAKDDPNNPLHNVSIMDLHPVTTKKNTTDNKNQTLLKEEIFKIVLEHNLLETIPVYMGRQPTLHRHSFQGFHAGVSETNAIEVNPLVCPAYNMDFDGDQAHVQIPISTNAIAEVNNLMITTSNIYLAKNGESTICPRQDMIYGLYLCTCNDNANHKNVQTFKCADYKSAYELVSNNRAAVWDRVTVQGNNMTAGDAAFIYCFAPNDVLPRSQCPMDEKGKPINPNGRYVEQITSDTIGKYVARLLTTCDGRPPYPVGSGDCPPGSFTGTINHLVALGFKVAKYYPPSVGLIDSVKEVGNIDVADPVTNETINTNYEQCYTTFYNDIQKPTTYYYLGLDTIDTYREKFNHSAKVLEATINAGIKKSLDKDNGYLLLAESGARGKTSNLRQIFKYKGQIQKDSTTSFDAIIENSYGNQLTPFELFINAYGGRQGQIDKSLKTGDTGYASRRMWHATQSYTITNKDCGTHNGVELTYNFFEQNFSSDSKPEEIFANWLDGHILVGETAPITPARAQVLASDHKAIYKLRSPLTCTNPCCQMCYGVDPSTHKLVTVGTAVGVIAAQSVGEPTTQLTMNTFHKGGVSGGSSVTSTFDTVNAYLLMQPMSKRPGYDPIAWDTGQIHTRPASQPGYVDVYIGNTSNRHITVSNKVELMQHATKGVGISAIRGNYDINELLKYTDIDTVQKYLIAKMYVLYSSEVNLKMQHLETLIASLTRYLIISTDRTVDTYTNDGTLLERHLTPGQCVTAQELHRGSLSNTHYVKRLISMKSSFTYTEDALDNIQMENVGRGIARMTAIHMCDSMQKPINRILFAQGIKSGTNLPNFMKDNAIRY